MSRWTLRMRLVALLLAALIPVLVLAGWRAVETATAVAGERDRQIAIAADLAVSRQREFLAGTRSLLLALRGNGDVLQSLAAKPPADARDRCEAYFQRVLSEAPGRYSALMLTDRMGLSLCSSAPVPPGTSFADRDVFALARQARDFVVASYTASRVSQDTVIPAAVPVLVDDQFGGMLAIGILLAPFAGSAAVRPSGLPVYVTLIDQEGHATAGPADSALTLPLAARTAQAISDGVDGFRDYGRNGDLYDYRLVTLAPSGLRAMAAVPAPPFVASIEPWIDFLLIFATTVLAVAALWIGAARWCLDPLKPIHAFAAAMARGGPADRLEAKGPPELRALATDVLAMATAIRSRESELRAGMEQRDHMLREIHHRVKNNLQMISSLLSLQGERIRSPRIRRHFSDAQNRVLALSILHRHLYERSSWALVDFQLFLNDLVRQLSMDRDRSAFANVRFDIRAPVMAVGPDTAIPVGLIVTEAISNSLRHAFAGIEAPRIEIHAVESDGEVEFRIEDNGVGFAAAQLGSDLPEGLGLSLVRGLAVQLGGEAEVSSVIGRGTRVVIRFALPRQAMAS